MYFPENCTVYKQKSSLNMTILSVYICIYFIIWIYNNSVHFYVSLHAHFLIISCIIRNILHSCVIVIVELVLPKCQVIFLWTVSCLFCICCIFINRNDVNCTYIHNIPPYPIQRVNFFFILNHLNKISFLSSVII